MEIPGDDVWCIFWYVFVFLCIYVYPDACGNPATVPWQGVVGIESDSDEFLYIVSVSFLVFFIDFHMILVSFWLPFDAFWCLLAPLWHPLGSFLAPLGPKLEQWPLGGELGENSWSKSELVLGLFFTLFGKKSVLGRLFRRSVFCIVFLSFCGRPGVPRNHENQVKPL